jgi:hypothetical protein
MTHYCQARFAAANWQAIFATSAHVIEVIRGAGNGRGEIARMDRA